MRWSMRSSTLAARAERTEAWLGDNLHDLCAHQPLLAMARRGLDSEPPMNELIVAVDAVVRSKGQRLVAERSTCTSAVPLASTSALWRSPEALHRGLCKGLVVCRDQGPEAAAAGAAPPSPHLRAIRLAFVTCEHIPDTLIRCSLNLRSCSITCSIKNGGLAGRFELAWLPLPMRLPDVPSPPWMQVWRHRRL